MGTYGLLGRKLAHSYSPQIHIALGCPPEEYHLFEKEPEELESFLRHPAFDGINVTIPYKLAVIPYMAELTDAARAIGSVNTIVPRPDGGLLGDNTDFYGLDETFRVASIDPAGKKALVLGGARGLKASRRAGNYHRLAPRGREF